MSITDNGFLYQPPLGGSGLTEWNSVQDGYQRVDDRLHKEIFLGDANYATLAAAITTIAGTECTLVIPAGVVVVSTNTTVPNNINLRVLRGADIQVASGVTLTINGGFEAGRYQVFSKIGTGLVSISGTVFPEWFGCVGDESTDDTDAFQWMLDCHQGGTIDFNPGANYAVDYLTLSTTNSNTVFNGNWATFTSTNIASPYYFITSSEAEFIDLTYETMTGNYVVGDTTIVVGGSYSADDWVYVRTSQCVPKTHKIGSNSANLVDTSSNFVSLGVTVGMTVDNITDGSSGTISSITTTTYANDTLVMTLSGGSENDWDVGDQYHIAILEDLPVAELVKVKSYAAGTLTLASPLTKDYTDDGYYPHGVAVANSIVIENITFRNIIFDVATRPSQLLNVAGCLIENCVVKACGGFGVRGRDITIKNNVINLSPGTTGIYGRPYYCAFDTGTSNAKFIDNYCTSEQVGIVHVHEGCSNVDIIGNKLLQGETDSFSLTGWPVISCQAYGWNINILHNTIINNPAATGDGIYIGTYIIGATVLNNTIDGTITRMGIRDVTNTYSHLIQNNILATCGTAKISATQTANIHYLGIANWAVMSGSPALTAFRTSRSMAWAFDKANIEQITSTWMVPEGVYSIQGQIDWAKGGIDVNSAHGVNWYVYLGSWDNGENMDVAEDGDWTPSLAVSANQNYLKTTTVSSTSYAVTPGQLITFRLGRYAITDDLDCDALFIGLRILCNL